MRIPDSSAADDSGVDPAETGEAAGALGTEDGHRAVAEEAWARLPVPGRHASRRRAGRADRGRRVVAGLLPAPLRGSASLGAAHLTVVAVVVALGLAATTWWVVRADPRAVQAPAPSLTPADADLVDLTPVAGAAPAGQEGPSSLPGPAPRATAGPEAGPARAAGSGAQSVSRSAGEAEEGPDDATVTVDVAGKVRRPGVVVLRAGSRVVDALAAAGGARRGVGLASLNLARVLLDGEQVLVGPPPRAAPPAPAASSSPTGAGTTPVDLNAADQATLETLPQVGPVTAEAIIAWREQHGAFTAVEELLEVDGIGELTLAQIAPHATV